MGLVKATRRRSVRIFDRLTLVCLVIGFAASGCADGCVDEGPGAEDDEADCRGLLRVPRDPRIVAVLADGSIKPEGACSSATCITGGTDVVLEYRDGRAVASIGGVPVEVTPNPASILHATPVIRGAVVGPRMLLVDAGETWQLHVAGEAPRSIPRPALPPDQFITGIQRVDGGVLAYVSGARGFFGTLVLVPPRAPPPRDGALPVPDENGALGGWIVRGSPGVLLDAEGRPQPIPVGPRTQVSREDGIWIVVENRKITLWRDGKSFALAMRSSILIDNGRALVVEGRPPGRIIEVDFSAEPPVAKPVLEVQPGHDFAGPLPEGTHVERIDVAKHGGALLIVERVRQPSCTVEDRVILFDVATRTGRVIASDDHMRMHPRWVGDAFRFVEADPEYATP
jgi:hypothetical protein